VPRVVARDEKGRFQRENDGPNYLNKRELLGAILAAENREKEDDIASQLRERLECEIQNAKRRTCPSIRNTEDL
jgi:hypothetical protein